MISPLTHSSFSNVLSLWVYVISGDLFAGDFKFYWIVVSTFEYVKAYFVFWYAFYLRKFSMGFWGKCVSGSIVCQMPIKIISCKMSLKFEPFYFNLFFYRTPLLLEVDLIWVFKSIIKAFLNLGAQEIGANMFRMVVSPWLIASLIRFILRVLARIF